MKQRIDTEARGRTSATTTVLLCVWTHIHHRRHRARRRRMMMLPISHLSRHTFHTNINSQYRSQDYSTTTHFLHQKTTRSNNGDDAGVVWWWWAGCWPRTTIKIRPITSVTRMNWCVVSTSSNISNNLRITQFPIYHLPLSSFQLHAVYYNKENAHQAPGHSS